VNDDMALHPPGWISDMYKSIACHYTRFYTVSGHTTVSKAEVVQKQKTKLFLTGRVKGVAAILQGSYPSRSRISILHVCPEHSYRHNISALWNQRNLPFNPPNLPQLPLACSLCALPGNMEGDGEERR